MRRIDQQRTKARAATVSTVQARRGRPPKATQPRGLDLDRPLGDRTGRHVAEGLLAVMRRDGRPWGEPMIARWLKRLDIDAEQAVPLADAMAQEGLLMRVPGAAGAWKARQP